MLKKLIVPAVLPMLALAVATFFIPSAEAADDTVLATPKIAGIFFDKPEYARGDKVDVFVRLADGAAVTENQKVSAAVTMITRGDAACVQPVLKTVSAGAKEFSIAAVATGDCSGYFATVALIGEGNTVFDVMTATTFSNKAETSVVADNTSAQTVQPASGIDLIRIVGAVVVGVLFLIGLVLIVRRRTVKPRVFMGFFLVFFGLSIVAGDAHAGTVSVGVSPWAYGSATSNKDVYTAGETAVVNSMLRSDGNAYSTCDGCSTYVSAVGVTYTVSISGNSNVQTHTFAQNPLVGIVWVDPWYTTANVTAPMTPGNYTVDVSVQYTISGSGGAGGGSSLPIKSIPITVVAPPASTGAAACGTANGGTFASAPTTGLCASGTASSVQDYGFWSWTCSPVVTCPPNPLFQDLVFTGCFTLVSGSSLLPVSCSANKSSAPPTVSFYPDSYSISAGTSTNLHWTATNATSCTASGAWSGAKAVSGTESTGILSASQVYFLSCTGPGGTSPLYTVPLTVIPVVPAVPTVDLQVNGSNGPVSLAAGASKNLSWTATNATSCTASSSDGFTGSKAVPSGSETLTVARTSTDTLKCDGPGGSATDTVQINATCTPSTGAWSSCDCATETKSRTNINATCGTWTESDACTADEINGCRDFNWKEVAP